MKTGSLDKKKRELRQEKRVVLVVDGDPVSQFYTCVILQRLDYHVISVRSAEEALVIMELTTPLLVLTEIVLPQMSGLDLLKQIKRDPRTKSVPVLIYTAVKAESQRSLYWEAGCSGFLLHTSDHNQMYEAVQQATESKPRHFIRLETWLDVVVAAPGSGSHAALITAISEHGMFVNTQKPLPSGTLVEFKMHLPNAGTKGLKLQGKVLHRRTTKNVRRSPGIGVMFLKVRPEDRALIKAFVEKKLMSGITQAGKTNGTKKKSSDRFYQPVTAQFSEVIE